jgi:thioredoxin-dependent peroxiredoxin
LSKLKPGQPATDFELPDQNGTLVRLSRFRGQSAVVIFFYPKDDTTGCTKEACGFRDRFEIFRAKGVRILGISSDSTASHQQFAAKFGLPYSPLSDDKGRVRKLYGVRSTFGVIPGRATFVIDRDGLLRNIFASQFQPERHVEEALRALGVDREKER